MLSICISRLLRCFYPQRAGPFYLLSSPSNKCGRHAVTLQPHLLARTRRSVVLQRLQEGSWMWLSSIPLNMYLRWQHQQAFKQFTLWKLPNTLIMSEPSSLSDWLTSPSFIHACCADASSASLTTRTRETKSTLWWPFLWRGSTWRAGFGMTRTKLMWVFSSCMCLYSLDAVLF